MAENYHFLIIVSVVQLTRIQSFYLTKTPYTPCARAYLQPTRREESLVFAFSDVDLSDLFDLSDLS